MPASKKVPRSDGETKTKNVTGPTRKLSRREERTKEIREALFKAAFQTVGEFGYAGSTVQLITRRARVANGTFYNYFSSQNELFERLLPELGERLRDFVDKQIRDAADAADVERIMLRGNDIEAPTAASRSAAEEIRRPAADVDGSATTSS